MRLFTERKESAKPALYQVQRFTGSPLMWTLSLLLALNGVLSLVRPVQRLLWLLFDFKPNGTVWEMVFLALHEGWTLLVCVLAVLTGIGALLLTVGQKNVGGRLLRRI